MGPCLSFEFGVIIMQVSVEKLSNVEHRLTITVPVDTVEQAYKNKISSFAKKANIKGFRPGKAPLGVIKQQFGQDAQHQVFNELIESAIKEAIEETQLKPVNVRQVTPKTIKVDQPLEFTVIFEVFPDIEKVQFEMESIEKFLVDITPQDVSRVIEQLIKQHTKWKPVERPAQAKDRVLIDYTSIFEGKEETDKKVQNFPLEIGGKVMIPGFEDGLTGAAAGEERKLQLHFPDDFHIKEQAGKPVEFVVSVKKVYEAEVPVLNSEFIQKLGIKSGKEEDLQQQITKSLEQERDRVVRNHLKEQVFNKLLEQNSLDIPHSMIEREARHLHDEVYQHEHDHHKHTEEEMKTFESLAKKRVTIGLLVAEIVKKEQLVADNNKVAERIQEIANSYEKPEEVIQWLSANKENLTNIQAQVMEDQVINKLIEKAAIVEKPMSYAELKDL